MALFAVLLVGAIACAVMALRATRLLVSALWLAGTSALTALVLYLLGAQTIAVIELSVGVGLVTILFVFAISVAGDEAGAAAGAGVLDVRAIVPKPLAVALVVVAAVALGGLTLAQPATNAGAAAIGTAGTTGTAATPAGPLVDLLWQQRGLDVLVQIVLIFGGVMGVLGLLADAKSPNPKSQIGNPYSDEAHS